MDTSELSLIQIIPETMQKYLLNRVQFQGKGSALTRRAQIEEDGFLDSSNAVIRNAVAYFIFREERSKLINKYSSVQINHFNT